MRIVEMVVSCEKCNAELFTKNRLQSSYILSRVVDFFIGKKYYSHYNCPTLGVKSKQPKVKELDDYWWPPYTSLKRLSRTPDRWGWFFSGHDAATSVLNKLHYY